MHIFAQFGTSYRIVPILVYLRLKLYAGVHQKVQKVVQKR